MSTRAIRVSTGQSNCDVCGRTLLRGERAEIYLSGGARHSVCELCTSRALHDGWVREGEVPEYDEGRSRDDRRRSLFHRLRSRRDARDIRADPAEPEPEPYFEDEPGLEEPEPAPRPAPAPRAPAASPSWPDPVRAAAARFSGGREPRSAPPREQRADAPREPRHVHAVPTSAEHRISSAVALFNESEHPRTVAGIARSLGLPDVSVHPSGPTASQVNIVVSWELCWYRYEVELAEEYPTVRKAAQGYELDELSEIERRNNAGADDRGQLELLGG